MKKIILLAGILVIGAVSANTITPGNENDKKEVVLKNRNDNKEIISNNEKAEALESKSTLKRECATVVVTCTSAYTCQDWSPQQWIDWGTQIQNNYCMIDSPFTP
jgi:hypothetical protein